MSADKFIYMPEDQVLNANGIVQVYRNSYWLVHKEKGLLFYRDNDKLGISRAYPQCNKNEKIASHLLSLSTIVYDKDNIEVKFIPLVLKPIEVQDYCS